MTRSDFEALFRRHLEEAARNAEAKLGRAVPRHFGVLHESPKANGRRTSVPEAVSELFISEDKFYRIIDLVVVEVSPSTTWVWVRPSGHEPASLEESWNTPPGSGPFKHLVAEEIRESALSL